MGYAIAVLACAIEDAPQLIAAMGLETTHTPDADNEKPLSGAISDEHYLIWRNWRSFTIAEYDFDYETLSKTAPFIVLDIDETTMTSALRRFMTGRLVWGVYAFDGDGLPLESSGDLPFDLDEVIKADAEKLALMNAGQEFQAEAGTFDIPSLAFVQMTGFQYDRVHDLSFFELATAMRQTGKPKGWLQNLFGKG